MNAEERNEKITSAISYCKVANFEYIDEVEAAAEEEARKASTENKTTTNNPDRASYWEESLKDRYEVQKVEEFNAMGKGNRSRKQMVSVEDEDLAGLEDVSSEGEDNNYEAELTDEETAASGILTGRRPYRKKINVEEERKGEEKTSLGEVRHGSGYGATTVGKLTSGASFFIQESPRAKSGWGRYDQLKSGIIPVGSNLRGFTEKGITFCTEGILMQGGDSVSGKAVHVWHFFQNLFSQNDLPDLDSLVQIKNRDTNRVRTVARGPTRALLQFLATLLGNFRELDSNSGSPGTIASEGSDISRETQFKGNQGQSRLVRHRSSVQQSSDQQSLSISPVCGWVEISAFATETDIPVAQLD
ncbi:hypothetical protein HYC85_027880 [Camellia sinensis]|uniref:DUF1087 domain-containing protein n=1 Tax=Camellia sinensis TaxID=4442 RepID=A0A7J7FTV0_CAMSI|nr:hypothetical protein HYC85_027880 [Camellia sinensis]